MTKIHRKKITLPQKLISRRFTLYTRDASGDIMLGFLLILCFTVGISLLRGQIYIAASLLFSFIGLVIYSKFREVQKIEIFEDTMFVKYVDVTETYKAEEIESVEWVLVQFGRHINFTQLTPKLLIQTRNEKKIRIPPPGGLDIQKSILDWRDKYLASSDTKIITNE